MRTKHGVAMLACLGFLLGTGSATYGRAYTQALDPVAVYVSNNGTANQGDVDRFSLSLQLQKTFDAGNNEGVELDALGNLYQAGDVTTGTGTVRIVSRIGDRANGDRYVVTKDRELGGALTNLVAPKGMLIAQERGYMIIADFGAKDLKVFGSSAGGNVAPLAITALPVAPWDVAYDERQDRLFVALTDGTVAVFDMYLGNGSTIGAGGINRRFTPVDAVGTKASTNLHGIAYDAARDSLVVSDVGAATAMQSPNFASDGRIYVLNNASTADGNVRAARTIEGAATLLGNPVDLILNGTDVRVAEKANDRLLLFSAIFDGASGDIAPDLAVAETKPEALVAQVGNSRINPDVTDVEQSSLAIASLATTSNPPTAKDFVARLSPNLTSVATTFDTSAGIASIENITYDRLGDAFITFDDGLTPNQSGGILIVNRLAKTRDNGTFNAARDRTIQGALTGMVSPKGLDIVDTLGLVMVAENNATTPAVLVFSTQAIGNVAPVARTTNLDGHVPWDLDYDPTADRLYVAATDGTVLVFDQYTQNYGVVGPSRVITPFNPGGTARASVNLHGIIHVASSNTLLLSDVGSAMSPTDGQLFVLDNAATAQGNVAVRTQISGPDTKLGNPVDITFDGRHLYVAEKSNDLVMRYDDILVRSGTSGAAADVTLARNKPESVALVPDYLSRTPESSFIIRLPMILK